MWITAWAAMVNASGALRCVAGAYASIVLALAATGCGGTAQGGTVTIHVFAASSLTEPFSELEREFETAHPDVDVVLSFAGSQDLVAQMEAGAPADVFASASQSWMGKAQQAGLVDDTPKVFARNYLEIAVAAGNPKSIAGLDDLQNRPELVSARCAPAVPCGALTDQVLHARAASVQFDTEQNSVTDTLGLVASGEADAALVYATDVRTAQGDVEGIQIPESRTFTTEYPIVTIASDDARRHDRAQRFVNFVTGETGQQVLSDSGFLPGMPDGP